MTFRGPKIIKKRRFSEENKQKKELTQFQNNRKSFVPARWRSGTVENPLCPLDGARVPSNTKVFLAPSDSSAELLSDLTMTDVEQSFLMGCKTQIQCQMSENDCYVPAGAC